MGLIVKAAVVSESTVHRWEQWGDVIVFVGSVSLSGRDDCMIQICKQAETERWCADKHVLFPLDPPARLNHVLKLGPNIIEISKTIPLVSCMVDDANFTLINHID